jgi:hypothetical protein
MKIDPLERAKSIITKVWVTPENKKRYENGEIVVSSIWGKENGLVELEIRASQCHSVFRNGRPYIKNTDWTWAEIDNFIP